MLPAEIATFHSKVLDMGASGSVKVGFQMRIYDFGPGVEHLPVVTSMAQDALQKPQGTLKNHKTRNWSNYP